MTEGEIVDLEVRMLTGSDAERASLAVEHFDRLLKFAREMVDKQDTGRLNAEHCPDCDCFD